MALVDHVILCLDIQELSGIRIYLTHVITRLLVKALDEELLCFLLFEETVFVRDSVEDEPNEEGKKEDENAVANKVPRPLCVIDYKVHVKQALVGPVIIK